jgi:hypothetical protein
MRGSLTPPLLARQQRWPWWPLLPLYPYGHRPTLMRELVPGRVWCFEQLHGIWYVAVPIRMTVLKVEAGLLLYAPLPPTAELLTELRTLEEQHGPVLTIVLATSSGLEHKLPVAALARAFPEASVWVSDMQWSFPLQLPPTWLGFPQDRTKVLFRDGLPHPQQLNWLPLGPIDLGLGTFHEIACIDQATGALLVTDALVALSATPPDIFQCDPTPLLFHARDRGSEALLDTPDNRTKGWKRIVLFANFFRPELLTIPSLAELVADARSSHDPSPRNHFGIYPFRWQDGWEEQADQWIQSCTDTVPCSLAPVLERLVFVRSKQIYLDWLRSLAKNDTISCLIAAHYSAKTPLSCHSLDHLADSLQSRDWAPSDQSWQTLAFIDRTLIKFGLVPH